SAMSKSSKLLGFITDAFTTSRPPEVNMERRVSRVDDVSSFNGGRRQSNAIQPQSEPNRGRRLSLNITCGAQEIPTVVVPAPQQPGGRGRSGSICVPALTMNLGGGREEETNEEKGEKEKKRSTLPVNGLSKRGGISKTNEKNRIVEEESENDD
ncbi:hypothetical protein PFISCL1PPCAC_1743, partial [Pristionchus fissidentatus]